MNTITKKHFIESLINNKSEFLSGSYVRNRSVDDILEYLQKVDFKTMKGETRQGFKHSKGLKFLKDDGSYSYADNLVNYDYHQTDNVLIAIGGQEDYLSLLVYRII